jgi:hypothetical protein
MSQMKHEPHTYYGQDQSPGYGYQYGPSSPAVTRKPPERFEISHATPYSEYEPRGRIPDNFNNVRRD